MCLRVGQIFIKNFRFEDNRITKYIESPARVFTLFLIVILAPSKWKNGFGWSISNYQSMFLYIHEGVLDKFDTPYSSSYIIVFWPFYHLGQALNWPNKLIWLTSLLHVFIYVYVRWVFHDVLLYAENSLTCVIWKLMNSKKYVFVIELYLIIHLIPCNFP